MKQHRITKTVIRKSGMLLSTLLLAFALVAQDKPSVNTRSGIKTMDIIWSEFLQGKKTIKFTDGEALLLVFCNSHTSDEQRSAFAQKGLRFLEYTGGKTWLASLKEKHQLGTIKTNAQVAGFYALQAKDKIQPNLQPQAGGTFKVRILGPVFKENIAAELKKRFPGKEFTTDRNGTTGASLSYEEMLEVAAHPSVTFIEDGDRQPTALNFETGSVLHSFPLHQSWNRGLMGSGVTIGIGDGGLIDFHVDYQNRVTRIDTIVASGWGNHPHHITGVAGGAGIMSEYAMGIAPKSHMLSCLFNNPILYAETFFSTYGMVITNNSYSLASSAWCPNLGNYDSDCRFIDRTVLKNPFLSHVIAAGNSGTINCAPYPVGFGTIAIGYQSAKNVITVGNVSSALCLSPSSSKGPTSDGRIKPEIMAKGQWVYSTIPTNSYGYGSGTSHAAPAVSGSLALIYERYKQLEGSNPPAGLIKAAVLNTATDLGNIGPDFSHGFGVMNTEAAVELLENNYYELGNVAHGDSISFNINVPASSGELRVSLYWNDTTASGFGNQALVNDLDLQVHTPGGATLLPWRLNTAKPSVNVAAGTGRDSINNIEQVTLKNPASGNYELKVFGHNLPMNAQDFFLVYDIHPVGVKLSGPYGGMKLVPGDSGYIYYESYGISSGAFTLEFSSDGGSTWSTISNAVPVRSGVYRYWAAPNTPTSTALHRISHAGLGVSDVTDTFFTILAKPVLVSATSCGEQAVIRWRNVNGATDYEVLHLENNNWVSVKITGDTFLYIPGYKSGSQHAFTIRGLINGAEGRRMDAFAVTINDNACGIGNDVGISRIPSLHSGRLLTHSVLSSTAVISAWIRNYSSSSKSNIPVLYSLNGAASISETYTGTLAANDSVLFSFSSTADLSAVGDYNLACWTGLAGDEVPSNDTSLVFFRQVDNNPISLPFLQDFENLEDILISDSSFALMGAQEIDYSTSTGYGRLRSTAGNGSVTGDRGIVLDKTVSNSILNQNFATATLNLSTYSGSNVFMNFDYLLSGEISSNGDSVWIRGADTLAWIPVFDLGNNGNPRSVFNRSPDIPVSKILTTAGQLGSSSFQIRFGQQGTGSMRSLMDYAGISIDNLRLYENLEDLKIYSFLSPLSRCGYGQDSLRISVINLGSNSISNIPVFYSLDGGVPFADTIRATLAENASMDFTFTEVIDISDNLLHTIDVWSGLSSDDNRANDTSAGNTFRFVGEINTFPFLDDFEAGSQEFYTEGTNNSWEWGTPTSYSLNRAASGDKVWATGLIDDYNPNEQSYLYSPCFDLQSMNNNARISYHGSYEIETFYDGYTVEYSEDGGTWNTLGTTGSNYNIYSMGSPFNYYEGSQTAWRVFGFEIPMVSITDKSHVQFRFVFNSDGGASYDGVSLDDFHIFDDATGVYAGPGLLAVQDTGTGSGWVHFDNGTDRVMSVSDLGNSIDATEAGVYINTSGLRFYNDQYTMDRNWWVLPTGATTGDFNVRLYFMESEVDALNSVDATINFFKDLGVTRYHGSREDSSFVNNDSLCPACFEFFAPELRVVPFFNGQYIQFNTGALSEFWINSGTMTQLVPLEENFSLLRGKREEGRIRIDWNVDKACVDGSFEVFSYTSETMKAQDGKSLGKVSGTCYKPLYSAFDRISEQEHYYRVIWTKPNGKKLVSDIIRIPGSSRSHNFSIQPNPSNGIFTIRSGENSGPVQLIVCTPDGKKVGGHTLNMVAGQSKQVNLNLAAGLYVLKIESGNYSQSEKLLISN